MGGIITELIAINVLFAAMKLTSFYSVSSGLRIQPHRSDSTYKDGLLRD